MFRKMRREKQQLTDAECAEVLSAAPRGVLAVHGENGYPYAFPMDFLYENDRLYFHCAKVGHKLDAIDADNRAAFCVMDEGFRRDGEWALNIKSVIVFGRIRRIDNRDVTLQIVRRLGLKYYPTAEGVDEEIRKAGAAVLVLELVPDCVTGKLVNES